MSTKRPSFVTADSLARAHTATAIGVLVSIVNDDTEKAQARVAAAKELLDRGHGKPTQAVVSIPARQAVAQKLAQLDDAALLAIAAAGRNSLPFDIDDADVIDVPALPAPTPPKEIEPWE
jgi:hypothetical protein